MSDTFQQKSEPGSVAGIEDGITALTIRHNDLRRMESVHRTNDVDVTVKETVEAKGMEEVDSKVRDRAKFLHRTVAKVVDENPEADKFDRHVEWLLANGAEFPRLYLRRYADDMRGVHTLVEIPPYERIVKVPLKCLVMDNMGMATPIGRKVTESGVNLTAPNHCMVIIFMLTDMESGDSFYQPYYDILPADFGNFPIFWDEEQMSWLEGSPLVQQIKDRKRNIRSDYDSLCRAAPEFARFSYDTFLWCRTAVGSRNFGISVNGGKRTAMVPFADMLNHFRPRETSWTFENNLQCFTMTSLSVLKPGQQVMDSYGKKCNSNFLMHYGFTLEVNREEDGRCMNEVPMTVMLRPDTEDPVRPSRLRFLGAGRYQRRFSLNMTYDDKSTSEMLSFLRAGTCTAQQLDELEASGRSGYNLGTYPIRPITLESELTALSLLARHCEVALEKYPTSRAADLELLGGDTLTPFSNRRHALIVILGEKEILTFYTTLRDILQELLPMSWEERMTTVRERYCGDDDVSRYLNNTLTILNNKARFTRNE